MSVQAIAWALTTQAGCTGAKCVLLALANYADENGECWPSQARLARETEQSVDSVQRRLHELETVGLIERKRRCKRGGGGRGRLPDFYLLNMRPKPQSAALKKPRAAVDKSDDQSRNLRPKSNDLSRTRNGPKPQWCGLYVDEPSRTVRKKQRRECGKAQSSAGKSKGGRSGLIADILAGRSVATAKPPPKPPEGSSTLAEALERFKQAREHHGT